MRAGCWPHTALNGSSAPSAAVPTPSRTCSVSRRTWDKPERVSRPHAVRSWCPSPRGGRYRCRRRVQTSTRTARVQLASSPANSDVDRRRRSSANAWRSAGSYRIARSVARMNLGPRPEHLILSNVDLDSPNRIAASRTSNRRRSADCSGVATGRVFSGRPRARDPRTKATRGSMAGDLSVVRAFSGAAASGRTASTRASCPPVDGARSENRSS